MDAESLAQIEQIVRGSEGRLRQEFGESIGTLTILFKRELAEKIEEWNRHNSAYAEELCRKLDLMIEGERDLHEDMDRLKTTIDQEFHKTQALIRSMMGQSNPIR